MEGNMIVKQKDLESLEGFQLDNPTKKTPPDDAAIWLLEQDSKNIKPEEMEAVYDAAAKAVLKG